jgi:hypothetical protein
VEEDRGREDLDEEEVINMYLHYITLQIYTDITILPSKYILNHLYPHNNPQFILITQYKPSKYIHIYHNNPTNLYNPIPYLYPTPLPTYLQALAKRLKIAFKVAKVGVGVGVVESHKSPKRVYLS